MRGTSGACTHAQHGIRFDFDVTKCMFSSGNTTERKRMGALTCSGETLVDLYCGIGYFTVPIMVHGKASFVHACDWNADAIRAIENNLLVNGIPRHCFALHEGDNAQHAPTAVADRVLLGLIPSSEAGWPVACRALKPGGGWMHVHHNVTTRASHTALQERAAWASEMARTMQTLLAQHNTAGARVAWTVDVHHVETVKSYAPRIYHVVADIHCRPLCNE